MATSIHGSTLSIYQSWLKYFILPTIATHLIISSWSWKKEIMAWITPINVDIRDSSPYLNCRFSNIVMVLQYPAHYLVHIGFPALLRIKKCFLWRTQDDMPASTWANGQFLVVETGQWTCQFVWPKLNFSNPVVVFCCSSWLDRSWSSWSIHRTTQQLPRLFLKVHCCSQGYSLSIAEWQRDLAWRTVFVCCRRDKATRDQSRAPNTLLIS